MQAKLNRIFSAPTIRLKTLVFIQILILLIFSLGGLFFFTRKALVDEAKKDAEQHLEATVQHVDNILQSIEQTAGNFYFELTEHLDEPERMATYCRHIIECNPNIAGCAIAFKPDYYPDSEYSVSFIRRKKYNSPELVSSEESLSKSYSKQNWFMETMKTGKPAWRDPGLNKEIKVEPTITFCLPLRDINNECVGVMAVGLAVNLLSQIVLHEKPTPFSYTTLLDKNGTYIIHHDQNKLAGQTVFTQPEIAASPSAMAAINEMLSGGTGNQSFELDDMTWYIFYKPFMRSDRPGRYMENLHWSIATIYPKSDIFGEYNHLVLHVLGISLIGLLVFFILSRFVIRRMMRPLVQITEMAEDMAEDMTEIMSEAPDEKRDDEIGFFQYHFHHMQKALADDIVKRKQLTENLNKHREKLRKTEEEILENDTVKTTFLHNVTNKMIQPAETIRNSVGILNNKIQDITSEEAKALVETIRQQSEHILELLSHKFTPKTSKPGKETNHE